MGKFTEFELQLKSMPLGIHEFEYRLEKQFFVNMESDEVRDANLVVKLKVNHKSELYDLDFEVTGTIAVPCDRCLDDLQLSTNAQYHIVVQYGDDYRDDSDELLIIPESDNTLNVAYMIYDTVALSIPIKHVHPKDECNKAMSEVYKKHRARVADDEDVDGVDDLLDDFEDIDGDNAGGVTDPRWNELKKLTENN